MRSASNIRRGAALLTFAALVAAPVMMTSGAGASVASSAPERAANQSGDNSSSEVLATLTVSSQKVSVRRDGKQKFKPATDGQALRQGDTIKTDATGTAEVDYGNDAFTRLDVNTTFTIVVLTDEQGARQVQGSLETGQTWNRTAALTESGSFEQEGAGANATVRGTAFSILCDTVDHCTFTAVVDDIDLTGLDGVTRLLTPLTQCESSDTSANGEVRDLTGVLCGDVTQVPADQLPDWILENLVKDLTLGLPDGGILTGTVVVSDDGTVSFVPGPTPGSDQASTAPGAPTNVNATGGDESATVSFSTPASNGGSPITSYTATATPSGGGPVSAAVVAVPVSASGPSSPITIVGLVNGTTYVFSVVATNAVGSSASSALSNAITPFGAPTIDASPVDIQTVGAFGCAIPGVVQGPGTQVVSQDECPSAVTFTLRAANPGAPSFWFVFTDLPSTPFGRLIDRGTNLNVATATNYVPTTHFVFAPVQVEQSNFTLCNSSPSAANCFSDYPGYPGSFTQNSPVNGSIAWTDTFTVEARNDAGLSDSETVTLIAVDDICTTADEGNRAGARTVLGCPAYPGTATP